jgi:hypothetical protein
MMTKKKLTKKQKQQMLYNATMIAEGAMDETSEMSYIQAWQHLVDTGVLETPRLLRKKPSHRMLSDGTLQPAPIEEETPNNEDEQ